MVIVLSRFSACKQQEDWILTKRKSLSCGLSFQLCYFCHLNFASFVINLSNFCWLSGFQTSDWIFCRDMNYISGREERRKREKLQYIPSGFSPYLSWCDKDSEVENDKSKGSAGYRKVQTCATDKWLVDLWIYLHISFSTINDF